jgi:hypothetical protein
MDPISRMMMGGLAVFVAWTVLRAFRSGAVHSENLECTLEGNPLIFSLGVVVHAGLAVFCTALAAGYTVLDIWQFCAGFL